MSNGSLRHRVDQLLADTQRPTRAAKETALERLRSLTNDQMLRLGVQRTERITAAFEAEAKYWKGQQ